MRNINTIICISILLYGCGVKEEAGMAEEGDLSGAFSRASKLTIKVLYIPDYSEYNDYYYMHNYDQKDSIPINAGDYRIIKNFRGKGFLFFVHLDTNIQYRIETVQFYLYNRMLTKNIMSNKVFLDQLDEYILDENIPDKSDFHLGMLEHLKTISIIMPIKDRYGLDSLAIPDYLNHIASWHFQNFIFNHLVFPKESEVVLIWLDFSTRKENRLVSDMELDNVSLSGLAKLKRLVSYYPLVHRLRLRNLPKLSRIHFLGVKDVFLSNLPSLEAVELQHNKMEEFAMENCPLVKSIDLTGNRLEDIRIESAPNLKKIFLVGNPIKDIEAIRRRYPNIEIYFTEEEYGAYRREIVALKKIYPSIRKFLTPQSQKKIEEVFQSVN